MGISKTGCLNVALIRQKTTLVGNFREAVSGLGYCTIDWSTKYFLDKDYEVTSQEIGELKQARLGCLIHGRQLLFSHLTSFHTIILILYC